MVTPESWHPKDSRSCSKFIQTKLCIALKWWQTLSTDFHNTKKGHFERFLDSKTWFTLWKWFQMWSTRIDSESPHLCGCFGTKIEVVTMTNIRVRFYSTPWTQSAPVGGDSLESLLTFVNYLIGELSFPRQILSLQQMFLPDPNYYKPPPEARRAEALPR